MKTIVLLMFSLVSISAQENLNTTTISNATALEWKAPRAYAFTFYKGANAAAVATFRQIEGDDSAIELDLGETILRGGGGHTAPSLSMRRYGQGLFMAALPTGGTLSIYRHVGSEKREWIRFSSSGIQVAGTDGNIKGTFNGVIRSGCSAVVTEGLITGEDCGSAKSRQGYFNRVGHPLLEGVRIY